MKKLRFGKLVSAMLTLALIFVMFPSFGGTTAFAATTTLSINATPAYSDTSGPTLTFTLFPDSDESGSFGSPLDSFPEGTVAVTVKYSDPTIADYVDPTLISVADGAPSAQYHILHSSYSNFDKISSVVFTFTSTDGNTTGTTTYYRQPSFTVSTDIGPHTLPGSTGYQDALIFNLITQPSHLSSSSHYLYNGGNYSFIERVGSTDRLISTEPVVRNVTFAISMDDFNPDATYIIAFTPNSTAEDESKSAAISKEIVASSIDLSTRYTTEFTTFLEFGFTLDVLNFKISVAENMFFPAGTFSLETKSGTTIDTHSVNYANESATLNLGINDFPTVDEEYNIVFTPTLTNIFSENTVTKTLYGSLFSPLTPSSLPSGGSVNFAQATLSPSSAVFSGVTFDQISTTDMSSSNSIKNIDSAKLGQMLGEKIKAEGISLESLGTMTSVFDLTLTGTSGGAIYPYLGSEKFSITIPVTGIADGTKISMVHYTGLIYYNGSFTNSLNNLGIEILTGVVTNGAVTFNNANGLSPFVIFVSPYEPPTSSSSSSSTEATPAAAFSPQTGVYEAR